MPTPSPKHDTQFQSDDGGTPGTWAGALVVDDSGNGNTLTQGVTGTTKGYILAASAGDFTVDPEFNVTIRFNHNTGNTNGYIYCRQNPTGTSVRHGILVGNASTTSLQFVVNAAIVATMTMPGSFPASGGDDVVVEWSGCANPLTTGAADAQYNEVRCWNETDDHVEGINFTSAVPTSISVSDLIFGGRHPALATQDYSGELIDIHYGTRFHSSTESYNDWIATATAPTLTAHAPLELPVPNSSSGFGAEDELVGPVYALAAGASVRNSLITASPLVNSLPMSGQGTFLDGDPDPSRWRSTNVPNDGADTWYWIGQYTYYPPAGLNYNRLKVHLHIQYTDPQGDDTLFRVYSMSAHPDSPELALPGLEPAEPIEYYYATATVDAATDDGSGTTGGAWYELTPFKIARAPGDQATFIGVAVLPASGGPDYRVRTIHVEPLVVDAESPGDNDGLDFG